MKPAVSVIVPVYNPGAFFERCISSLCSQTLRDIEIIFVDDCSSDGSRDIIGKYAESDGRIIVIDSDVRLGAGRARNIGIGRARGEMLAFVDSDDFIDADFLEKLWNRHIETGADIVKGERKRFNPAIGEFSPDSRYWQKIHEKVKRDKYFFFGPFTSAIYNADIVRVHNIRFPEGVTFFEDLFFPIVVSVFNKKTETVDGAFYCYSINPDSTCHQTPMSVRVSDRIKVNVAILDILRMSQISEEHRLCVCDFLFYEMFSICRDIYVSDDVTRNAVNGIVQMLKLCNNQEEQLVRLFLRLKKEKRSKLAGMIRKSKE